MYPSLVFDALAAQGATSSECSQGYGHFARQKDELDARETGKSEAHSKVAAVGAECLHSWGFRNPVGPELRFREWPVPARARRTFLHQRPAPGALRSGYRQGCMINSNRESAPASFHNHVKREDWLGFNGPFRQQRVLRLPPRRWSPGFLASPVSPILGSHEHQAVQEQDAQGCHKGHRGPPTTA